MCVLYFAWGVVRVFHLVGNKVYENDLKLYLWILCIHVMVLFHAALIWSGGFKITILVMDQIPKEGLIYSKESKENMDQKDWIPGILIRIWIQQGISA